MKLSSAWRTTFFGEVEEEDIIIISLCRWLVCCVGCSAEIQIAVGYY